MSEMLALSHVNFNHPCSISSGVLVISILCWAYVLLVCRVCVFFIGLFVLSNSPFDTCCFLFIALCGFIARRCVVVQKLRYISSIPRSIYIVYTQYRLWTEIISALYRIHNCHMNCLWLFWSIENFMFYYCICRHRQLTTLTHTHICYSMCSNNITVSHNPRDFLVSNSHYMNVYRSNHTYAESTSRQRRQWICRNCLH